MVMKEKNFVYKFLNNFKWLLRMAKKQRRLLTIYLPISVCLGVVTNFLGISFPSIIIFLLDRTVTLNNDFVIILSLSFILGVFLWISGWLVTKVFWESIKVRMTLQVLDGKGFINLPYFKLINVDTQKERAQSAAYGYENDNSGVGLFVPAMVLLCQNVLMLVIAGGVSAVVAWWSPIIVAITCIISFKILSYFSSQRLRIQKDLGKVYLEQNYLYRKSFDTSAGQEIRIYFLERKFGLKIKQCRDEITVIKKKLALNSFKAKTFIVLVNFCRSIPIYLVLAQKVFHGEMSVVEFSFLFSLLGMLNVYIKEGSNNLEEFLNANNDISKSRVYLDAIERMITLDEHADNQGLPESISPDHLEIQLKNIFVKYPDQEKFILRDINLRIKPGEHIALVGLNGAGKTTLVLTIMGIIEPYSGEILVNGIPLSKSWIRSYQHLFAPAFQENVLLADTLEKNIVISESINKQKLMKIAEQVTLNKTISKLPQGMQTYLTRYIHDNGLIPSGGELQKIILGRALYRDSPFIILDEPTAALDSLTESLLYQQMENLFKGKTSLFISHRLASTKFADNIILLKDGQIEAYGSHKVLLSESAEYRKIFNVQKQLYESEITNE